VTLYTGSEESKISFKTRKDGKCKPVIQSAITLINNQNEHYCDWSQYWGKFKLNSVKSSCLIPRGTFLPAVLHYTLRTAKYKGRGPMPRGGRTCLNHQSSFCQKVGFWSRTQGENPPKLRTYSVTTWGVMG
jgi:hypothetical protein